MKPLKIEPTKFTPKIDFNPATRIFQVSGFSLPENVALFYDPLMKWMEKFSETLTSDGTPIQFYFKLTYYNSGSFKAIINILLKLSNIYKNGHKVEIHWHYDQDDFQLREIGEELSEMVGLPFSFYTN